MLDFRKKKGTADIHLLPDGHRVQPTVWLSNENICGRAVFKLPANITVSQAKVQLRGKKEEATLQPINADVEIL